MIQITERISIIPYRSSFGYLPGTGAPNSTIIRDEDSFLIIDPGVKTYQLKELKKLRKQTEFDLSKVKHIFFTHQHWDHIILGSIFQKKYKVELLSHLEEKEAIENGEILYSNFWNNFLFFEKQINIYPKWAIKAAMRYLWGSYSPMKINHTIEDREKFFLGERVEFLHLPGHTPGLTSLFIPEKKILVAGDLFDLEIGYGADLDCPISNYDKALKSLKKLLDLDINILIPGHGPVIKGKELIKAIVLERIEQTQQLRRQLLKLLEKGKFTLNNLTMRVFPEGNNFTLFLFRKSLIYCVLESIYKKEGFNILEGKKTKITRT
ncbi:MAG: MBL fold metallo-hydrolase [Candidatus Heimdallarchaeaceae archaeon]